MQLFLSIVNHHHDHVITSNPYLKEIASKYKVIVKSNTQASCKLSEFCKLNNIELIQGTRIKGFGANNNEVFSHIKANYGITDDTFFLAINPDVEIECVEIDNLLEKIDRKAPQISTINLFRDKEHTVHDNSIRHFPTLTNPIKSFFGINRKDLYDKSTIKENTTIDWAAGSFLLFNARLYEKLNGFDERFFMYFEDVDICRRAKSLSIETIYYPDIKAHHNASHANRRLFTKTFYHYMRSTFIYFTKRY